MDPAARLAAGKVTGPVIEPVTERVPKAAAVAVTGLVMTAAAGALDAGPE
jgi:hypothetical protein